MWVVTYEQLALDWTRPADPPPLPQQRTPEPPATPALPSLPTKRPRGQAGRVFDALEALCACSAGCGEVFADESALLVHRPKTECGNPRALGMTLLDRPVPCWALPKEIAARPKDRRGSNGDDEPAPLITPRRATPVTARATLPDCLGVRVAAPGSRPPAIIPPTPEPADSTLLPRDYECYGTKEDR